MIIKKVNRFIVYYSPVPYKAFVSNANICTAYEYINKARLAIQTDPLTHIFLSPTP